MSEEQIVIMWVVTLLYTFAAWAVLFASLQRIARALESIRNTLRDKQ